RGGGAARAAKGRGGHRASLIGRWLVSDVGSADGRSGRAGRGAAAPRAVAAAAGRRYFRIAPAFSLASPRAVPSEDRNT
ncbi:MAG TPA: hypothetical protein VHM02_11570, partial [Thermoanaerobaculia bacterium]|nr:hypothetical protein [Thermoanaerobaculia bacterium]